MIYQVIVDNEVIKEYEHREQAVIWCYMNGFIVSGKGYKWLVNAEIREVER